MSRTNMASHRIEAQTPGLVTLHVLRTRRISPGFVRVTLGGGDVADFVPLGYDQWFRLFLPVSDTSLSRVPQKLTTLSYLKFLTVAKTDRPVLRNYTVRAYRADGPDGPEIDVDFVLHGSVADGTSGPAASWAQSCEPGDSVAILDEGVAFNRGDDTGPVMLVADETGLPAVAGVLASLPAETTGHAIVEVGHADDCLQLDKPDGITLTWVVRTAAHAAPGAAALDAVESTPVPDGLGYGFVVGEQGLVARTRRHWVAAGVPKDAITFVGYWKNGHAH